MSQIKNKQLMDSLVGALSDIERAEKEGDKECRFHRDRFAVLYGEILAKLDGAVWPFAEGDLVRLKPEFARNPPSHLLADRVYHVHRAYYDGNGQWLIVLEEFRFSADWVRYGAIVFEKVKIVRVA